MDDCRKIAETEEYTRDVKLLAIGVYTLSVGIGILLIFIEALRGSSKTVIDILPSISITPMVTILTILKPRRCYIYKKGIKIGRRFVEWDEVIEHEWKDSLLEMRFKGKPKRIVIVDRDGKIKGIVEKYVYGG